MGAAVLSSTIVVLLLSASPAAESTPPAAGPGSAAPGAERDPPPGAPADQALWARAVKSDEDIAVERHRAARLQLRARTGEYVERLLAIEAGAEPADARRAAELRRRVRAKWDESVSLLVRPWPVDPTRGCGYPLLNFESALHTAAGGKGSPVGARKDLQECLEKAAIPVSALRRSNEELASALAAADAVLGAPRAIEEASAEPRRAAPHAAAGAAK